MHIWMGISHRGIRAPKIKMIVMACNKDGYDVANEKISEIITLSKENDIPVIFELDKRQLSKSINKTIKVSFVGMCKMLMVHMNKLRH